MQIGSLFKLRKYRRVFQRTKKKIKRVFKRPAESVPVFVFGKQRSGTTIFMNVLEARDDTEVYQEWDKKVFTDCRIKSFDILKEAIENSKAPFVCFKPICDSHLMEQFVRVAPRVKIIWIYRDYMDNVNSSVRRFSTADKAIREIIEGKKTEGWFYEGISPEMLSTLRGIYLPDMTKLEMACLVWWARNKIIFDFKGMQDHLLIVKYEELVTDPLGTFVEISEFTGMLIDEASLSQIHSGSIKKNKYPEIRDSIRNLCEELTGRYEEIRKDKHK